MSFFTRFFKINKVEAPDKNVLDRFEKLEDEKDCYIYNGFVIKLSLLREHTYPEQEIIWIYDLYEAEYEGDKVSKGTHLQLQLVKGGKEEAMVRACERVEETILNEAGIKIIKE
jgi:hypothetical protein